MPNLPKLELEYPCVKTIKNRMKKIDEISEDQVKGFDRRVRNSPFILTIIQYASQKSNTGKRGWDKFYELEKEMNRIEQTPYMNLQRENERLTEGMLRLKQENEDLKAQLKKLNPSYPSS